MKTITSIKAIIFICVLSSVLLLTACSKSSDPTPAAEVQPTVTTTAVT
jgi:PBP1b-binding outer membrane lipoprotein LpoB